METQTLRVEAAAKALGIGRTAAYAAVRRGEIPSLKIGGLRLVPKAALDDMLKNPARVQVSANTEA